MMSIAVDTNVLVRLATGDSVAEHAAAESLVADNPIFIPTTVLLETEWVLRSRYAYSPKQFIAYTEWLVQQPDIEFEGRNLILRAVDLHAIGFDFADAMHLVASAGRQFASFDRGLIRQARAKGLSVRPMTQR